MRPLLAAAAMVVAATATTATSAQAADSAARAGDAVASVSGSHVTLASSGIVRRWQIAEGGSVSATDLYDPVSGRRWAAAGAPDFTIALDSAPTSSTQGWELADVTASRLPDDPARPAAGHGVQLLFRYRPGPGLALPAGAPSTPGEPPLELDRTYTLHPGSADIEVSERLVNRTPAVIRVGAYSLAEVTSASPVTAEVQAYHGGSDWRDDYRAISRETGAFDDEGEVMRLDDGTGSGWYMVSEHRGGSMSRAAREAGGRTWIGVDNARDAFDYGPLQSSPPTYNRQDNPAYPAPVRQRTLMPLQTLDLGRAHLGVYHGGAGEAAATFATEFAAHTMPAFTRSIGLNTFHPWGHGAGMSDANLRPQVDAAASLGIESFMLDDSWQDLSGDWNFRPSKFPDSDNDGDADFVDYLHSKGLKLALWMSPLEFNGASKTYAAHPDWACAPIGDATAQVPNDPGLGVWDVTNPGLRAYLLATIDRLVSQLDVTEFKFDFLTWVDCPPHDYLDYEDAFVSLVREMQARHPNVTFEFDETNDQRMWPLESVALGPSWFDNGHLHGSTPQAKLLHDLWSAAPWIPTSTIGAGALDGTLGGPYTPAYLMPMALLGHITFWTDLVALSGADAAETRWWLSWYRDHRDALSGAVYEDTAADPLDGRSWVGLQPWRRDHGYLFAFRQADGPATQSISLQGVDPARSYTVTDVRSATVLGVFSGAALRAGLPVTLATPYSAEVLSIDPA